MKKLSIPFASLILLLLFISCNTQKQLGSQPLRFNLEKGKTYAYDMKWEISQDVMDQSFKIEVSNKYDLEVLNENEEQKTLRITYGKIMTTLQMEDSTLVIDGNPKEGDHEGIQKMGEVFRKLEGQSFNMDVNREGKILKIYGFENIRKQFADMMPDAGEDPASSQVLDQHLNDENIKKSFEQMFFIFPNKEVKLGDSWTKRVVLEGVFPMKFENTYTVKSIEGDYITLELDSDISSDFTQFKLTGDQKGVLQVERKSGLVINADINMVTQMKGENMQFTQKGSGKITGRVK